MGQIHIDTRLAECAQSKEHKRHAEEEIAYILAPFIINQDNGNEECGINKVGNVE